MGTLYILKKVVIFPVIICSLEYTKNILYDVRGGKDVYSQTSSINFRNYRILKGSKKKFDVDYFYDSVVSLVHLEDSDEECDETKGVSDNENTKKVHTEIEKCPDHEKLKGTKMLKTNLDGTDIVSCNYLDGDNKVPVTDNISNYLELTNEYNYNNKTYEPTLSIYQDNSLVKPNDSPENEHSKLLRASGRHILDVDLQKYENEYNKHNSQECTTNVKQNNVANKELKDKILDTAINIVIGILIIGTIGPAFPFMLIKKERFDTQVKNMWKFYKSAFTRENQKKQ
ncbi:fam-b protein [Plasmodium vinckei vinckei]|uniref:Fam-b protein n=1 Tax=Plasmodium vinckei vinckei TaxID=54757 RepID=A0A449BM97_PLAVN|nr:fam-b protein [Plasmodium vinckei vinckei]VEV54529.1 fam-b protein [Plasmodium vinckei vinckei]